MKSLQAIFDQVVEHLMQQGCQAINKDGVCQYLDSNGRRCAVGCLIDPKHYSDTLEGLSIGSAVRDQFQRESAKQLVDALRNSGIELNESATLMLLDALQAIHDYRNVSDWPSHLRQVATQFNLQYNYGSEKAVSS